MIDSELVPWGKGEKYPGEGAEIVSETIRLQKVGVPIYRDDGVPIEEWANEFVVCCWSKLEKSAGAVKARMKVRKLNLIFLVSSFFWSLVIFFSMQQAQDPKPSDLSMARLKFSESWMEDRTHSPCNTRGWAVVSGEIPIELGNSWFSPKQL